MEEFSSKVVLVTGASRGMGAAIAAAFALRKAFVFANYPSEDADEHRSAIEQWRQEAGISEGQVIPIEANVADVGQVSKMFQIVQNKFGKLDILINNAGINRDRTVAKMTDEQWHQVLAVNLNGPFYCCRSAIAMLSEGGRIINTTSLAAHIGIFGIANYAASKAGVLALTRTLALELASRKITVNAICPGYIDTNMTRTMPETVLNQIVERIPLKRKGSVQDIASCVLFLASGSADYITGQSISVNGGIYLGG